MFASIGAALRLFTERDFRGTVLKSVGLTLALFLALLVGFEALLLALPALGSPWVNRALEWMGPILFLLGLVFLGAPVAALFGSLFLDGVAARIEARDYAGDPPARGMSLTTGLQAGLALAGAVIGIDLVLLPFDVTLPGAAELATLAANGWLLGREYFELAALRHVSREEVGRLRLAHRGEITAAGMLVALLSMVPLVNLVAPLFGTALMVHLFKRIQKRTPR